MPNSLVWFRKDLRTQDNQALSEACRYARLHSGRVYALYIATPAQWRQHNTAAIQLDFTERNLQSLAGQLAKMGIALSVVHLDDFSYCADYIHSFCITHHIGCLFAHSEPEINEQKRDKQVGETLKRAEISSLFYAGHCLLPYGSVLNKQTDRQTNKEINRGTDERTGSDKQTDRQSKRDG